MPSTPPALDTRGASSVFLAAASALVVAGCNLVTQVQGGPVVAIVDRAPVVGGEANLSGYLDLNASTDWFDCHMQSAAMCPPPSESARRAGPAAGVYVRGSRLGFGTGVEPGLFIASTDAGKILLAAGGGRFGLETLQGTARASAGAYARLSAGFTIRKTYDPHAVVLCRVLTYLTFSLQGTLDAMPAASAPSTVQALSLLVGIATLDDSGAASDMNVPGARCPR